VRSSSRPSANLQHMTLSSETRDTLGDGPKTPPPILRARQHEYALASRQWFSSAVDIAARALDPVYEQISWRQMESVSESVATLTDSEEIILPATTFSAESAIDISTMIEFDIEGIQANVVHIAEQFVRQTIGSFIEAVSKITEKTGNVVQSQSGIDGFIAALEAVDVEFDENGRPTTQIIVHSDTYKKLKEEEASASPEQLQRLTSLLDQKRKEYLASRRRRRLPRLSY